MNMQQQYFGDDFQSLSVGIGTISLSSNNAVGTPAGQYHNANPEGAIQIKEEMPDSYPATLWQQPNQSSCPRMMNQEVLMSQQQFQCNQNPLSMQQQWVPSNIGTEFQYISDGLQSLSHGSNNAMENPAGQMHNVKLEGASQIKEEMIDTCPPPPTITLTNQQILYNLLRNIQTPLSPHLAETEGSSHIIKSHPLLMAAINEQRQLYQDRLEWTSSR